MRGAHRVIEQNKRIRYNFEIKRNITVIRGDSATGKTALVDMVREHFENGDASGVELFCDKKCAVLDGRTWEAQLSVIKDCIVFIRTYNEFYHLYRAEGNNQTVKPEKVITEDSNSGYQFFQGICARENQIACVSYLKYAKRQLNPAYLQQKSSEKILAAMKGVELRQR